MTDISHLVVNGCSFTYGEGLNDPANEAWPAIVAKNLNVPIVNLARGGLGNDSIHRRTYEYFYEDSQNKNNPFYIISFSNFSRKEFYFKPHKRYKKVLENLYDTSKEIDVAQQYYLENLDYSALYKESLIYKNSLINLFEANNIPYVFLSIMHMGKEEKEIEEHVHKMFPQLMDSISKNSNNLKSQHDILGLNYKTLPCGHYDVETNKRLGDYITTQIQNRYQLNIVPRNNFLTLDDYTKNIEPYYDYWEQKDVFGAWL